MTYKNLDELESLLQLWRIKGLGIIIQVPSGVFYANQTGGYACLQSYLEGCFLPIETGLEDYRTKKLRKYFSGPKHNRGCTQGIDNKDADFIDEVLDMFPSDFFSVDRNRLNDSHESWVYIVINKHLDKYNENDKNLLYGLNGKKGVLTWLNSD